MAVPLNASGMPVWGDVIAGSLSAWRAANPAALCANLEGRADLTDTDLAPFAGTGILAVNLFGCTGITSACFAHLRGITHLRIRGLTQPTIVAPDFVQLAGLVALYASGCTQLNDAALAPLAGLRTLYVSDVQGFTEAAFVPLRGLAFLEMRRCATPRTQAGFEPLAGGITTLDMEGCSPEAIAAAVAAGLPATGAPAP